MVAPATIAPVASVTLPVMLPKVVWARPSSAAARRKIANAPAATRRGKTEKRLIPVIEHLLWRPLVTDCNWVCPGTKARPLNRPGKTPRQVHISYHICHMAYEIWLPLRILPTLLLLNSSQTAPFVPFRSLPCPGH